VFVVWEPVIFTDWYAPRSAVLARVSDSRAKQFWDRNLLLSEGIKQSLERKGSEHMARIREEGRGVVWDIVALFPRGVLWETDFPEPLFLGAPVVYVIEEFRRRIQEIG
jgi:hypothetical protein